MAIRWDRVSTWYAERSRSRRHRPSAASSSISSAKYRPTARRMSHSLVAAGTTGAPTIDPIVRSRSGVGRNAVATTIRPSPWTRTGNQSSATSRRGSTPFSSAGSTGSAVRSTNAQSHISDSTR